MKKLLISIILFISASMVAATTTIPVPNDDFLLKNDFYFSCCGIGGSELKFLKNNNFYISYNIDGGSAWYNEGNYKIAGNDIVLHSVKCSQEKGGPVIDCKKSTGEIVCNLEKNDDSLFYSRYLRCRPRDYGHPLAADFKYQQFDYPVKDSRVKAGETKKADGIIVITTGDISAVTTSNVKMREKPSVTAKEIEFRLYPDYRSPFVPEKEKITVYARTMKKERVQNWENYWYYVHAGYRSKGAWMFGEFIKLKD